MGSKPKSTHSAGRKVDDGMGMEELRGTLVGPECLTEALL